MLDDLKEVMKGEKYKGGVILITKDGYWWNFKLYSSLKAVKKAIDESILSLNKSIKS